MDNLGAIGGPLLALALVELVGVRSAILRGCRPARDTGAAIQRAGVQIQKSERIMFAASRFEPAIPHILAIARRA